MVYFNCVQCGTGLRKNQVDTHMKMCRSRTYSCIDCQKDFKNDEYKSHVKCLTESERYESKGFVAKQNKGDVKQNAWFEKVLKAVETFRGSPRAKSLLEKLTDYPNVPRKKAKFFNFIRNSFRSFNVTDGQLEEIWNVIESFDKAEKAQNTQNGQNGNKNNGNNLKRKIEDDENLKNDHVPCENISTSDVQTEAFDWKQVIKEQCSKNENNLITLEKLQKKVFKKYKKFKSDDKKENELNDDSTIEMEKFKKKLNKKLKKMTDLFSLIEQESTKMIKCTDINE